MVSHNLKCKSGKLFFLSDLIGVGIIMVTHATIKKLSRGDRGPRNNSTLGGKLYVLATQRAGSIYVLDPDSQFIQLKFAREKREMEGLFVGKQWLCNMLRPSA